MAYYDSVTSNGMVTLHVALHGGDGVTIRALADELGTTPKTIYHKCKQHGIKVQELRIDGELPADAISMIAGLFDASESVTGSETGSRQVNVTGDVTGDAESVMARLARLEATCDGLRALVDQLQSERDDLRVQVSSLSAALQREQADRQSERLLLTAGADAAGGGWFRRLFSRRG